MLGQPKGVKAGVKYPLNRLGKAQETRSHTCALGKLGGAKARALTDSCLSAPRALSFILGTWLNQYAEDFVQPPDFLCLKQLVAYLHINMPGSEEECQARFLLTHLENLQLSNMEPVGEKVGQKHYRAH
jgi:hypothetical protein